MGRPTAATARKRQAEALRNPRVRAIDAKGWRFQRIAKFQRAVRFAAAAKATRTALGVSQAEVAREYRVTTTAVAHWESGAYHGWNPEALADLDAVRVAVNQDYARPGDPVAPGDEVALFPPVTGG